MSQGNLINTNSPLDLAIEGEGYFVLNDGSRDLYTRAGALAVDAQSNLVDPSTGYIVQRTGTVGENDNFQTAGNSGIKIPYGIGISANATSQIRVSGNLSANATLPGGVQTNKLRSNIIYTEGSSNATASTRISDLDQYTGTTWADGTLTFSGWKPDGTALGTGPTTDLTMAVDVNTTMQDVFEH
jgi:flagellar hook protein FlgE